eukprot:764444-Ditylum_brightwellii.AAC.1
MLQHSTTTGKSWYSKEERLSAAAKVIDEERGQGWSTTSSRASRARMHPSGTSGRGPRAIPLLMPLLLHLLKNKNKSK